MVLFTKVVALTLLNKMALQIVRALKYTCNVPKFFRGDAILTSTHLINRLPTRVLSYISPLDKLHATRVTSYLDHSLPLCTFGCIVYAHIHHPPSKFDPWSIPCISLGYSNCQKGYRCYDPKSKHIFVREMSPLLKQHPFTHSLPVRGRIGMTLSLLVLYLNLYHPLIS